jgi:cobyric acid synthase
VLDGEHPRPDGHRAGKVWGTYQHGCFEAPESRRRLAAAAGIVGHAAPDFTWKEKRLRVYEAMADHIVAHVDLGLIRRYLGL